MLQETLLRAASKICRAGFSKPISDETIIASNLNHQTNAAVSEHKVPTKAALSGDQPEIPRPAFRSRTSGKNLFATRRKYTKRE